MLTEPLLTSLRESWAFFVHLGVVLFPLFIGGSFLVGLAQEYLPPEAIERKLRSYDGGTGNVAAAGFGAVTPFCSCSTVPVLAGLLQAGAPIGLAVSFLLASPIVNEIAVVLLLGLFGPVITAAYVAATLTAAVVGGLLIGRVASRESLRDLDPLGGPRTAVATDGGTTGCGCDCEQSTAPDTGGRHRERVANALRSAWSFFGETLPYLLLGMAVGALVHNVVPRSVLMPVLGPENPFAVLIAAVAGAPIYVSMSGMLPIAASLSERGIAIGTVLAFVIGGAGVSLPNLVLLHKLFKPKLLGLYVGVVVAVGVTVGSLFNVLLAGV